jgi:hypothetical protein
MSKKVLLKFEMQRGPTVYIPSDSIDCFWQEEADFGSNRHTYLRTKGGSSIRVNEEAEDIAETLEPYMDHGNRTAKPGGPR